MQSSRGIGLLMAGEVKKERPWWLRLDGAPPGWVDRLWPAARPLTKRRVLFLRIWFLGVAVALVVAIILRAWFLVGPLSVQFIQVLLWPKEAREQVVSALMHGVRPPT